MLGAAIRGLFCLLPYRNVTLVTPVILILLSRILRTALKTYGVLRNPYMEGVIHGRTVPVYPDDKGNYRTPADTQIYATMLASRSNHALGIFAPGFKELGDYSVAMWEELHNNARVHG